MASETENSGSGPCSGLEPHVADRVEAVMPAEGITRENVSVTTVRRVASELTSYTRRLDRVLWPSK